jgi:hypothetical protein
MRNATVQVLEGKFAEEAELLAELLRMAPRDAEKWRPEWPSASGEMPFTLGQLTAHLVEAYGGMCGCFVKLYPQQLENWMSLRQRIDAGQNLDLDQSVALLGECRDCILEGFGLLDDESLTLSIPTYFSPEGEPFLGVLLTNWKHIQNHNYQLFLYLKLLGLPVSTRHLYKFKEA